MKQAVLFAFSRRGIETAVRIAAFLETEYGCRIYAPEKYAGEGGQEISGSDEAISGSDEVISGSDEVISGSDEVIPGSDRVVPGNVQALPGNVGAFTGTIFDSVDVLVYVGACGIAVRAIAPYIKNKTVDPAVICVDERATFCVALLSGHIGGGNRLTKEIAEQIGATPVVTTATDVNQRFAVDEWAAGQGFVIGSMTGAKEVSAAILERDVPISADMPIRKKLPAGLYAGDTGAIGIFVSVYKKEPYAETLAIIPRVLTLGIGCRRGTPWEAIEMAVQSVLTDHNLHFRAVKAVASIDLKADEQGLLLFCKKHELPITFYSAEQLLAVEGAFDSSGFVQSVTGVDNVCERSAAASGGNIMIRKTVCSGVTVAVAQSDWEVNFG